MNALDLTDSLAVAYGLTDAADRLLSADAPLAELQDRCGGDLPGTLAIPELLALVQQARAMGLRIARAFTAFDGDAEVSGFARIHPLGEEDGGGCEVLVENWHRSPLTPPSARDFAERLDAIDRATAEVSARLDARQRVVVLNGGAPDAAALQAAALAEPGRVWSELVELADITHHQPLHWRLMDGALCRYSGSQRDWRVRLIPLGPDTQHPAGFELLLIADAPLAGGGEEQGGEADATLDAAPSRLVGTALTPVLRQPVARIIANAETIRARLAGPLRDEYSDYAGTIGSAGQHLAAMLDDLADLEVVEAPGFATVREPVDLHDAAARAAGILGVRAHNRETVLVVEGERGSAIAAAEFRRVLQILINLIGNAIAYAPAASTVTISVHAASSSAAIGHAASSSAAIGHAASSSAAIGHAASSSEAIGHKDSRVAVTVADEGPGVTAEQATRIFDKGERLGRESDGGRGGNKDGGSGLGLYISRRLAQAMAGDLTVEAAPGGGALFRLELPAA